MQAMILNQVLYGYAAATHGESQINKQSQESNLKNISQEVTKKMEVKKSETSYKPTLLPTKYTPSTTGEKVKALFARNKQKTPTVKEQVDQILNGVDTTKSIWPKVLKAAESIDTSKKNLEKAIDESKDLEKKVQKYNKKHGIITKPIISALAVKPPEIKKMTMRERSEYLIKLGENAIDSCIEGEHRLYMALKEVEGMLNNINSNDHS